MPRSVGTPHKVDISGKRFGKWVVVSRSHSAEWNCICDCGTKKVVHGSTLTMGTSTSCGCAGKDWCRKHGMEGSGVYNTWAGMKQRCQNPKKHNYADYGGRGIKVCDRWQTFENFYADMGDKPEGTTLGRIDNDGDYEPSNVRWETAKQQQRNRRNTSFVGKDALANLAEEHDIPIKKLRARINSGYSIDEALSKVRLPKGRNAKRRLHTSR